MNARENRPSETAQLLLDHQNTLDPDSVEQSNSFAVLVSHLCTFFTYDNLADYYYFAENIALIHERDADKWILRVQRPRGTDETDDEDDSISSMDSSGVPPSLKPYFEAEERRQNRG